MRKNLILSITLYKKRVSFCNFFLTGQKERKNYKCYTPPHARTHAHGPVTYGGPSGAANSDFWKIGW